MEEKNPESPLVEITIKNLPILEQVQFASANLPMTNELIRYIEAAGYRKKIREDKKSWSREMQLAVMLHNNKGSQVSIRRSAIDELGHEIATNAFRFCMVFLKRVVIRPIDHACVMTWYVEQIVDIEETIKLNKFTLTENK